MKIGEIMHRNLAKVDAESTIAEAARLMDTRNIGSLLVEENDKIVGIMTERDILKKVVAAGLDYRSTRVKDIMTSNLVSADVETGIEEASGILDRNKIRRLVVTENDKIVGIITTRDIIERMRYSFASSITANRHTAYGRPS